MFALIKKDIIFTKKWILLSVVYAVVATWLIMHVYSFYVINFFNKLICYTNNWL